MNPVDISLQSASGGWDMIASYGPIWGAALLAFSLAQTFLKRNGATHWLAQGRTLALITGSVSVGGAVMAWKFQGADLSGVIVTAIMAIKLAMTPTVSA